MVALAGVIRDTRQRWGLAPSLVNLFVQLQARYPKRRTRSDGSIGDDAHALRDSDHNPRFFRSEPGWSGGWYVLGGDVDADLDNDPTTNDAPEVSLIIAACIAHPATQYVIHDGIIWNRSRGFRPVQYTGHNPHKGHIHVSIIRTRAAIMNDDPWFPNTPEVDDMPYTPTQLTEIVQNAVRRTPFTNKDGKTYALEDIVAAIDSNVLNIGHAVKALPDQLLKTQVTAMDPATGEGTNISVGQALGRGSEATILRQNDGIRKATDKGTETSMMEAILAKIPDNNAPGPSRN